MSYQFNFSTGKFDIVNPTPDLSGYVLKSGSLADISNHSHTVLTDIGTNTHPTIDTHLAKTALDSHGTTASTDINFAKYKAIAMACDNGTSFPSTPAEAQWFYRTDILTLFIYEAAWKSIISFGAVSYYVDGTNGSDVAGQGFSATTGATATMTYLWANCVPSVIGGNVNINVAGGTYTDNWNLYGKNFSGSYTITITGAKTILLNTTTLTSAAQNSGDTFSTITATGAFTGLTLAGKMVVCSKAAQTDQYYLIKSHTNDVLTLATSIGATVPNNTWTLVVYDWASIVSPASSLTVYTLGQKNLNIYWCKFVGVNNTTVAQFDSHSGVNILYCWLVGSGSGSAIRFNQYSWGFIYSSYLQGATTVGSIYLQQSYAALTGVWISLSGAGYGITGDNMALCHAGIGSNYIYGAGGATKLTYGVYLSKSSVFNSSASSTSFRIFIENATTGVYGYSLASFIFVSNYRYITCTTNYVNYLTDTTLIKLPDDTSMYSVTASAATVIPIVSKGASSQSADLQQWQKSDGTVYTSINSVGVLFPVQATTAAAPAYVKGGLYFDTTLNKLRVGGASAWETVTSV